MRALEVVGSTPALRTFSFSFAHYDCVVFLAACAERCVTEQREKASERALRAPRVGERGVVAVVVGESTIRYQGRAKGRLPGVAAGARRPKTPNTMPRGKRPKLFVFDLDVSPPPRLGIPRAGSTDPSNSTSFLSFFSLILLKTRTPSGGQRCIC